ncbi:MAG: ATP synthase F0 subunit B [Candidatus Peribacteria bacterium]|nr:MAG: ATP synthase F0 subunit B [Candidatus Peribacteria bacterium]
MELHNFQFFTLETLVIHAIILLIILWVLNKFLFQPYMSYLDEEAEKRKKLEDDYKNIDKLVKDAESEKATMLTEAREKSSQMISEAESLANKKRSTIIENAEKDAKELVEASRGEIEKERLSMMSGVKTQLIDLILKFNSKLFKEEKISKEYLEGELKKIHS